MLEVKFKKEYPNFTLNEVYKVFKIRFEDVELPDDLEEKIEKMENDITHDGIDLDELEERHINKEPQEAVIIWLLLSNNKGNLELIDSTYLKCLER